jgi:hypothetical protein
VNSEGGMTIDTAHAIIGTHLIDGAAHEGAGPPFRAVNPRDDAELEPAFRDADAELIRAATTAAAAAQE